MKENLFYRITHSRSETKIWIDNIDVWVRFVARPLSYLITYPLMKLNVSANVASMISMVISLAGLASVVVFKTDGILPAILIFNFWIIFDAVDGNIASTLQKQSNKGTYIDAISGYLYLMTLYITLGLGVFYQTNNPIWIVVGFLTSLMTTFPRLVLQKKIAMFGVNEKDSSAKLNYGLKEILAMNIAGAAGLMNPLMIMAYCFNFLGAYLIFYMLVQGALGVMTIISSFKVVFNEFEETA
ncbi:CDP-alcohol phosphatidyltransferase family protein [Weissella confusa]|uniref:CDP-alcohol phosphatidyltransferase family protein n=1 Tax=Weissella confusa TaxID=1583 RepID=UPI0022E3B1C5|nr:CDP-alcohol phosphatidyltransferase family protein [Weissella confusa]